MNLLSTSQTECPCFSCAVRVLHCTTYLHVRKGHVVTKSAMHADVPADMSWLRNLRHRTIAE